jgi:3-oxoacyl-ACP reductase-like protein
MLDKMNDSDKKAYKKRLIEACRESLTASAGNIKLAMDEAQNSANEYGVPKDRYDSYRTQILRKRDMFARQLQQAIDQIEILNKIDVKIVHEKVEFGSVVFTEKQKMFIATGIGKVEFEGEDVFVISPYVPVFEVMKGKKAGDEVDFRGMKNKILMVF